MLRFLMVLAVAGTIMAGAFASAAQLDVDGGAIQAGGDATLWCDNDGIRVVAWGMNTYPEAEGAAYMTVAGVSPACDGARIMGRVQSSDGGVYYTSGINENGAGQYFVIAGGSEATEYRLFFKDRSFATQQYVLAEGIESIKVWIEGQN